MLHPLVEQARVLLRSAPIKWEVLVPPQGCLDISVAPCNVERALALFDLAIRAVESMGFAVASPEDSYHKTVVLVEDQRVSLLVHEVVLRRSEATGRLWLSIGQSLGLNGQYWEDGTGPRGVGFVESCIPALVAHLAKAVPSIRVGLVERQQQARESAAAALQVQEQSKRMSRVQEEVAAWTKASTLREYARAVAGSGQLPGMSEELRQAQEAWTTWILATADELDPTVNPAWRMSRFPR